MLNARFLTMAAILGVALAGCNCGETIDPEDSADTGNPPIEYPDGGRPPVGDGGLDPGVIKVTCPDPALPTPINSPVTVTCEIQAEGRSISAPKLTASPSEGVVLDNGTQPGTVTFALRTINNGGYRHPFDYEDTTYTVTVEVRNAVNTAEYGRATFKVTVLGNYWVGDGQGSTSQGIYVLGSDGKFLGSGPYIGPSGIQSVSDLRVLSNGDVIASSAKNKVIRVFNRKGVPQPPESFASEDPYTGYMLWDWFQYSYDEPGPHQMAISGTGELWVAGAAEDKTWGLAVLNPTDGKFIKFVPHPNPTNQFSFTSIVCRSDGTILASSKKKRTICLFGEKDYASKGCVDVSTSEGSYFSSFLALPDARVLVGVWGNATNGEGMVVLNPTLAIEAVSDKVYRPEMSGLAQSGDELLALGGYGGSVGDAEITRFRYDAGAGTIKHLGDPSDWRLRPPNASLYTAAGLIRLTPPGR